MQISPSQFIATQNIPITTSQFTSQISPSQITTNSTRNRLLQYHSRSSSPSSPYQPPLKKKKTSSDKVDTVLIETLQQIQEKHKTDINDEDYHFCMQIHATFKKIEDRKRAMAKLQILQYLTSLQYSFDCQPSFHYGGQRSPPSPSMHHPFISDGTQCFN